MTAPSPEHKPSGLPLYLVISTGVIATLVAYLGISIGKLPSLPGAQSQGQKNISILSKLTPEQELRLGGQIAQQQCAGCHSLKERLIGPSYQEIASTFKQQNDKSGLSQGDVPQLAAAMQHPAKPAKDDYPPGPQLLLSDDERVEVAAWIIDQTSKSGNQKHD